MLGSTLAGSRSMSFMSLQKNARNEAVALQARAKALREQQRGRIDARHKYILGLVARRVEVDEAAVEDFMLDGDQVRAALSCETTTTC